MNGGKAVKTTGVFLFIVIAVSLISGCFGGILPTYTLTMQKVGSGTVQPSEGSHLYLSGMEVTVNALPAAGWQFSHWTGPVVSPNQQTTTVRMNANHTVTAHFVQATGTQYTLTMQKDGQGNVQPAVGQHQYPAGSEVTVSATPSSGWQFSHWTGPVASPNQATTTVHMDNNKTVKAWFVQLVQTGAVEGYVYISDGSQIPALGTEIMPANYRPLPNAQVILERSGYSPRQTTTNTNGFFRLDNVPAGTWNLKVVSSVLLRDYHHGPIQVTAGQTTRFDGSGAIRLGTGYFLIVGIDNYQYLPNRAGGVANANKVYDAFAAAGMDSYVRRLLNNQATYNNIANSIYDVIELAQPGDYFVIYLSGYYGGGGGISPDYFIPYDGDDADGFRAITDGLLEDWLYLANYNGTHVTVLLDFPHSGYFMDGFRTDEGDFGGQALLGNNRTTVIASGDGPSHVYSNLGGTSPFSHFLAKGLSSPFPADANSNGTITSSEIFSYLTAQMASYFSAQGIPTADRTVPVRYQYQETPIVRYQ